MSPVIVTAKPCGSRAFRLSLAFCTHQPFAPQRSHRSEKESTGGSGVGVEVGVEVLVDVGVGVFVDVGVKVLVGVGVFVDVGVKVLVGVEV